MNASQVSKNDVCLLFLLIYGVTTIYLNISVVVTLVHIRINRFMSGKMFDIQKICYYFQVIFLYLNALDIVLE